MLIAKCVVLSLLSISVVAIVPGCSHRTKADLLIDAACDGDAPYCEKLVKDGIPVDSTDGLGNTALMWAVFYCRKNVVASLLRLGADANHEGQCGLSPLMCTGFPMLDHELHGTEAERNEIAEMLIQHGADVNEVSGTGKYIGDGQTALHFAASSKNAGLVRILLRAGANRDIKSNQGYTALDTAKFPVLAPNDDVISLLEGRTH